MRTVVRVMSAAAWIVPTTSVMAQPAEPISGDAVAGLVSRTAKSEVHLIADPKLSGRRLVLKLVVLNRDGIAHGFGPGAVWIADERGVMVALTPRETLLAELAGPQGSGFENNQMRSAASMATNSAGQADVTGFSGSMGTMAGGLPPATMDRATRGASTADQQALDAVLLKNVMIASGKADGGQVVSAKLKPEKTPTLLVSVSFADETHRFAVAVPRR